MQDATINTHLGKTYPDLQAELLAAKQAMTEADQTYRATKRWNDYQTFHAARDTHQRALEAHNVGQLRLLELNTQLIRAEGAWQRADFAWRNDMTSQAKWDDWNRSLISVSRAAQAVVEFETGIA